MIKFIRGCLLLVWLSNGLLVGQVMKKLNLLTAKRELLLMIFMEAGAKIIFPYMFAEDELFRKVHK